MRTRHLLVFGLVLVLLAASTGSTSPSQPGMDARISALESEVAALRAELALLATDDVRIPALEQKQDGFLRIPGIPGPSVRDGHEDEIEVFAWAWGTHKPAEAAPIARDVAVLKRTDMASPALFNASASGEEIPEVTLSFRRTIEGETADYLVITLKDVVVSGVEFGIGGSDQDVITELVTFTAGKIVMEYDDTYIAGWDFVANTPI